MSVAESSGNHVIVLEGQLGCHVTVFFNISIGTIWPFWSWFQAQVPPVGLDGVLDSLVERMAIRVI